MPILTTQKQKSKICWAPGVDTWVAGSNAQWMWQWSNVFKTQSKTSKWWDSWTIYHSKL